MSILTHRCACGHIREEHDDHGQCQQNYCPCKRKEFGPTELLPTFMTDGSHDEILTVSPPGSRWNGQQGTYLCNCEECQAKAREMSWSD